MIKNSGILAVENKPREAVQQRHHQLSPSKQLSVLLPETENGGKEDEARPRFRFDSVVPDEEQDLPTSPMRVLLCNIKTMKYFRSGERWTRNPRKALDFRNGWWATVHAFTMDPRHLVIHYEFEDDRYNLHIPVLGD